ncbi:MAG: ThuA domain-containing protein [Halioglobus sp.]
MLKVFKWFLMLLVVLVVLSLIGIWYIGAWNILFPSHTHEIQPPTLPATLTSPAVLVFTKTNGFRHADGIEGGKAAIDALSKSDGFSVFATENGAVFNARDLALFDSVIFLNATGDLFNEQQEQAFAQWIMGGGGWVGIHAAGDSSHAGWDWYREELIGADFTAHIMGPQFQAAKVVLENQWHSVLANLPDTWLHTEEWYSWAESPRVEGFTVLATLDEESYSPVQKIFGNENDLSMGDHPVVWSNCIGEGRSVYLAMGHRADAFEQPQVRQLLKNAIAWSRAGGECKTARDAMQ